MIRNKIIKFETKGFNDIVDITKEASDFASEFTEGLLNVFVQGSTLSVTTIEYEEGVVEQDDYEEAYEEELEYVELKNSSQEMNNRKKLYMENDYSGQIDNQDSSNQLDSAKNIDFQQKQ